jgi:hypothetical protein
MSSSDEEAEEAEVANIVVPPELEEAEVANIVVPPELEEEQDKMDIDDDNVDGERLKKKGRDSSDEEHIVRGKKSCPLDLREIALQAKQREEIRAVGFLSTLSTLTNSLKRK